MLLLAIVLLGCWGGPAASDETDPVAHAVELARIVRADPANAEAALAEKGVSLEEFEEMLFDIAADPVQSDAYVAALGE